MGSGAIKYCPLNQTNNNITKSVKIPRHLLISGSCPETLQSIGPFLLEPQRTLPLFKMTNSKGKSGGKVSANIPRPSYINIPSFLLISGSLPDMASYSPTLPNIGNFISKPQSTPPFLLSKMMPNSPACNPHIILPPTTATPTTLPHNSIPLPK